MSIGNKIADLRKEQKLTQKDLAEKLNVSDKVISRWETGASLPDVEMMKKLSQVFGVTIAELYDALDEDDGNADEKDNYERIWQYYDYERIWKYRRSTIIASALFCIATLLAVFVIWFAAVGNETNWQLEIWLVLLSLDIVIACVSIIWEIVATASLRSFSKTKYYRTLYNDSLKKNLLSYVIVCAVCIVGILTPWFIFVLVMIS